MCSTSWSGSPSKSCAATGMPVSPSESATIWSPGLLARSMIACISPVSPGFMARAPEKSLCTPQVSSLSPAPCSTIVDPVDIWLSQLVESTCSSTSSHVSSATPVSRTLFASGGACLAASTATSGDQDSASTVDVPCPADGLTMSSTSTTSFNISRTNAVLRKLGMPELSATELTSLTTTSSSKSTKKIDWVDVFRKRKWSSLGAYSASLRARDPLAVEFADMHSAKQSLRKTLCEMFVRVVMLESEVPYTDMLTAAHVDVLNSAQKRVVNVVCTIFAHNVVCTNARVTCDSSIALWYYIYLISSVLFCRSGKRNSVCFYGAPSCGKSLLASIIASVVPGNLVGKFTMQAARSSFWFQSLLCKALYIGEEVCLDEQSAQSIKLLMEGNPSLTTDVKHGEHLPVPPRPVIITSNDPIWSCVSKEMAPLRERCYEFRFNSYVPLLNVTRNLSDQAAAWSYCVTRALALFPNFQDMDCEDEVILY